MDEKEVSEMQEEMMTVLVVEPMKAPYVKSIPNELEDLQQAVGGDIEMTYPFEDEVGILLNGNGKFEGLPLNRALYDDRGQVYDAIAGTFLVVAALSARSRPRRSPSRNCTEVSGFSPASSVT